MDRNETQEFAERLTELEIRSAHQERLLEELNSVLTLCAQRIDALERENRGFREMLGSLAATPDESPDE